MRGVLGTKPELEFMANRTIVITRFVHDTFLPGRCEDASEITDEHTPAVRLSEMSNASAALEDTSGAELCNVSAIVRRLV